MAIYTADLIGKKESVVDELLLLNGNTIPLVSLLGFGEPVYNTQHQWYEDEMFATKTTVDGAVLIGGTSITVKDAEPFQVNCVAKVGDEMVKVTGISDKVLTVVRGYADTVAAAIDDTTTIEYMWVEGVEGADARTARSKKRTTNYNYTQIIDETISISGSAEEVAQYGIDDLYENEKQKKQSEVALQLEKALISGVRYTNGSDIRMLGGIRNFIQTNVFDASGNVVTAEMIADMAQAIFEAGGFATGGMYKLLVSAKQKRAISNLNSDKISLERADNERGQTVDYVVTDFGVFEIVLDSNMNDDEIILADINRMAIRPLGKRSFAHEFLGKTGDSTTGQIVGEYTLEFLQEKAHGRIKNLG